MPGNQDELLPLWNNGVVGFKGFLCPSGVDEFLTITEKDIEVAYETLENTDALLAVIPFIFIRIECNSFYFINYTIFLQFHAEKCQPKDYEEEATSDDYEIDRGIQLN